MEDLPSFSFLDFFCGSGLVSTGVEPYFRTIWANDISSKKAVVFKANHDPSVFHHNSITEINGTDIPTARVSWASFPCQDLSLAGKIEGINGKRSGLVWQWLKVMDEMAEKPPIIVAENVTGLLSSENGEDYLALHNSLTQRGYNVGPLVLDASHWVPQSRKRVFIVGVDKKIDISDFITDMPNWAHPPAVVKTLALIPSVVWWKLPTPGQRKISLYDIVDFSAPPMDQRKSIHNLSLIPASHWEKLMSSNHNGITIATGYRRIRNDRQVMELRTDGLAGCLRTANGGSSRQYMVIYKNGWVTARLLTIKETVRLMGAPEEYVLPSNYNDAYSAMGDAVAVPVTRYLTENLLYPLARRTYESGR